MALVLTRIDDPRDGLSKARRKELELFAESQGVSEIVPGMPADLMRKILRMKGLTKIAVPNRPLGGTRPDTTSQTSVSASDGVDATDDLMRQWMEDRKEPVAEETPVPRKMTMGQLRKECKARGIVMSRKDNMETLKAKLASADK